MMRCNLPYRLMVLVVVAIVVLGAGYAFSEHGGVTQIYKAATGSVEAHRAISASVWEPEDIVLVKTPGGKKPFWTRTRKDKIERFKCSQCHNKETVDVADASEMAHGHIALDHGGEKEPLDCYTCHSLDDRNKLVNKKGEKLDMDHPYQLCGQCHFREKKDWEGGAHGKRIANWAGKRVVRNCTSCHDPHSPRFAPRWPATYTPPLP